MAKLASIRIITDDLERLVGFYESVTGIAADRPAPPFAELVSSVATFATGRATVGRMPEPSPEHSHMSLRARSRRAITPR